MIVAIFRANVKPGKAGEDYLALAAELEQIARSMPGFISYKSYYAEDGERLSVHEWRSAEDLKAWREHPTHVAAQNRGREEFYESYTLYVCDEPRESRFQN